MGTTRWRFVASSGESQRVEIMPGHNVWDHKWRSVMRNPPPPTGNEFEDTFAKYERANVIDPRYGATHVFSVYDITIEGRAVRFAAGEFSNGIFGFYLPEEGNDAA